MFGISLPNPLDVVPGMAGDSVGADLDPAGDEIAREGPALAHAMAYCCSNAACTNIFAGSVSSDKIAAQREKAKSNKCSDALAASAMVLQDVAVLEQAILSINALKKIVAAHYCLFGPARLKAINSAINHMDTSTQKSARLFFGMFAEVYAKRDVNCTSSTALFMAGAKAILTNTEAIKAFGIPEDETAAIFGSLVLHYRAAIEPEEFSLTGGLFGSTDFDAYEEVADIATRHPMVSLKQETQEQLNGIACELEGLLDKDELLVLQKFTFFRMGKAQDLALGEGVVSREDMHRAERAIRESNARADTLELRFNQMKGENERLKAENEELNENVVGWYAQCEDIKPRMVDLEKRSEMEKFSLTKKVEHLQTQLDTFKSKNKGLTERVATLTATHDRTKQQVMQEDAVMELQNAIQEAEGLYGRIEANEEQIGEYAQKVAEQADVIAALHVESVDLNVKTARFQEETAFLRKKADLATEGYRDAKLENRSLCQDLAAYTRRAHDLDFQLLTLNAERAIVLPRLTEEERCGMCLLQNANPLNTSQEKDAADRNASMISQLTVMAADNKRKLDMEWESNKAILNDMQHTLSLRDEEIQELKKQVKELTIECGIAKLGRNRFLAKSRELKSSLETAQDDKQQTIDHYLSEMKFFSEQYTSVTKSETKLRDDIDMVALATKALDLEGKSEHWKGLNKEMGEFSRVFKGGKTFIQRGSGGIQVYHSSEAPAETTGDDGP